MNEVDIAFAGSSQLTSDPSEGVVERELIILQDGTTLDLKAHIAAAVKLFGTAEQKVLAELPVSSLVGLGTQDSGPSVDTRTRAIKRPHLRIMTLMNQSVIQGLRMYLVLGLILQTMQRKG